MSNLVLRLKSLLGNDHVLSPEQAQQAGLSGFSLGTPIAVALPSSTQSVAKILRLCHEMGQSVVPWGGCTGLVEGQCADGALAISLRRMNHIEYINMDTATMTVEAGCILQNVAEAAEGKGMFFPVDLGAKGSATIGGNISTNAGGHRVLRFGMMREQVLGLEAVLADGTVISSLNQLIKNNTGYDLKQLFIGSEGTLGIVTRAVLRLRPKPSSQNMALLAVREFAHLSSILRTLEKGLGGTLSAFEVMWEDFYKLVTTPPAKGVPPLGLGHSYYVLVEALGAEQSEDALRFERSLETAMNNGWIADAVIAKSLSECEKLWALRDDVGQVVRDGPVITFDVSLRIGDMNAYLSALRAKLQSLWPSATLVVFGHLGDGNLHIIVGAGDSSKSTREDVEAIVYDALRAFSGSISAEHGIGLQKRDYLSYSRNAEEIALMRTLKRTLDPKNILNPGKIFT